MTNCWVDGRYVNAYESFEQGARFSDHSTADIIIQNQNYTDRYGHEHVGDMHYIYNKKQDVWIAAQNYDQDYYFKAVFAHEC